MLHSTSEWQSLDSRHFLHPFTDTKELELKGTRVITKAEGVYLWDSEGNQIIDGMAGLWCVNVGYGREELAKAAYEQLQQLPYYNSFFQCTHPPAIELSEKLAEISPPQFNHVFLFQHWVENIYCQHFIRDDLQSRIWRDQKFHVLRNCAKIYCTTALPD